MAEVASKILIEDKATNLYTTRLGETPNADADAIVKTGGISTNKFVPNINASKWNDECWLNINNKAVSIVGEKQSFTNGKIDLIVGNDCHRYYIDAEGRVNYDIIFSSVPKPEILFDLQFSRGLEFFYQPELDEEAILRGDYRPDNIIGSYAVFGQKAHNKYQTGKVCHIHRPKFIDANNNWIWGTLLIDPSANVISIRCDEDWLKKATYPITLDPTFGWTTGGGTAGADGAGGFTAPADGTITSISADLVGYSGSKIDYINQGYYLGTASSITTFVANGTAVNTNCTDRNFYPINVSGSITNGTLYWLRHSDRIVTAGIYSHYDTATGNYAGSLSSAWDNWGNNPTATFYTTLRRAMYATYTAASGLSIPVAMASGQLAGGFREMNGGIN